LVNILENKYYRRQWNQTQDLRAQFPQDRTKKFENTAIYLIHPLHHSMLQKQRLLSVHKPKICNIAPIYLKVCNQLGIPYKDFGIIAF